MRSWTPRRPSPLLEQKIFGEEIPEPQGRRRIMALPWYQTLGVSLAACAALMFTVLNITHSAGGRTITVQFAPLSNHLASLAMATAPHNTVSAPILEWTNENGDGLNLRSFDLLNTNRPLH